MKTSPAAVLRPSLREALRSLFADPREKAFFFALEGILVSRRGGVGPSASDVPVTLLADLERATDGAVAILSGDPLDEIDRILAPLRLAGCGLGGLEIRPHTGAPCVKRRVAGDLDPVRRLLEATAARDRWPTVIDGGLMLTLCHEGDPERAAVARSFAHEAVAIAPAAFRADFGDDATRVTFAGASMGGAVCGLMDGGCFVDRIPIVFGPAGRSNDYLTVAQYFGGTAVAVGSAEDGNADIRLDGPRDVQWIIQDFLAHLEIESGVVP